MYMCVWRRRYCDSLVLPAVYMCTQKILFVSALPRFVCVLHDNWRGKKKKKKNLDPFQKSAAAER